MKNRQKQINGLLLLLLSIFVLIPNIVFAQDDEAEKGKLKIKADRIIENDDYDNENLVETELEKTFPDLFKEETVEKIETKQTDNIEMTNKLKQQIFHEELPESTAIYEVKSELFTDDYSPARMNAQEEEDPEQSSQPSSLFMYGSIATFLGMVFGGILLVARNWGGS